MPDFEGFPTAVQASEAQFEAAVYHLLLSKPEIRASRLLYHRFLVEYDGRGSTALVDLAGRRLMVFERAAGENNVWGTLSREQKVSFNCAI
jgi:hypothetical protein